MVLMSEHHCLFQNEMRTLDEKNWLWELSERVKLSKVKLSVLTDSSIIIVLSATVWNTTKNAPNSLCSSSFMKYNYPFRMFMLLYRLY